MDMLNWDDSDIIVHYNITFSLFSILLPFFPFSPPKYGHICQSCDPLACLTALTHQVKFMSPVMFYPIVVPVFYSRLFFRTWILASPWFKHTPHTSCLCCTSAFMTHYCHLLAVYYKDTFWRWEERWVSTVHLNLRMRETVLVMFCCWGDFWGSLWTQ